MTNNPLTFTEETECYQVIYNSLTPEQQAHVKRYCNALVSHVKTYRGGKFRIAMNREMAMEVIVKLVQKGFMR
jgi:hypothetical protein